MDGSVPLARRPGHQAVLDVVVHHGGGEGLPVVKTDQLPGHIGDDLIHIQGNVGQLVPLGGALMLHALLQVHQFVHPGVLLPRFSLTLCYHGVIENANMIFNTTPQHVHRFSSQRRRRSSAFL